MEDTHLTSFEVSGFKKFTDLKVENIGQFNLIVGDNNVGKTTLLESLLIDKDSNKFLTGLFDVLRFVKRFDAYPTDFFSFYFSNNQDSFPQKITFQLNQNNGQNDILRYFRDKANKYSYKYKVKPEIPKIATEIFREIEIQFHFLTDQIKEFNFNIPYIPFGALYSHELTRLYSNNIQLYVDRKERLIDSLAFIITSIKNIEVNASYSSQPILLISEKGKNKLSPLATYGDGTIKFFRILLSLFANDHYNRIMIDEIESGVHYSRLKDFLKSLILVAKEQKKQIFATTHSKECIEYFTQALKEAECEVDARIIRLAETKSGIKAYTNIYDQFENALIAESELR